MNRNRVFGAVGFLAFGLLCSPPGFIEKSSAAEPPKAAASAAAKKGKATEPIKTTLKVSGMT